MTAPDGGPPSGRSTVGRWTSFTALFREVAKSDSCPEALLVVALWRERDGWNVVAQYEIAPYRIDIAIPEARLCIEVDGVFGHGAAEQKEADARRQAAIEARGWSFMRYTAASAFLRPGELAGEVRDRVVARRAEVKAGEAAQALGEVERMVDHLEANGQEADHVANARERIDALQNLETLRQLSGTWGAEDEKTLRDRQLARLAPALRRGSR